MGFVTLQDLADYNATRPARRRRGGHWGLGQTPATPPAPVISSIQPTQGSPGVTITINGANLEGATVVTFGGVPAASFVVVSPTQISAVVAPNSVTGPVAVTTPGGTASYGSFTMLPAVPAGTLVEEAVDDVLRPAGLPTDVPQVYTLDRLYAIQNAATARGVDASQVVALVRQEVYRRVLQADPNPQGDLTDLALRLTGTTAYSTQAPPPPVPTPTYAPSYAPAPTYAPQVPVYQQPAQIPLPAVPVEQTPRRRRGAPVEAAATPYGLPSWAPLAAAALGGAVLVALLVRR
jgi:hypothetical protein